MTPPAPDIRWRQRLHSYRRALVTLADAADLASRRPLTPLEQQGLIQAFEFTHELAWNVMKDFLQAQGVTKPLFGSRDSTREAFATGLIADGDQWMAMIASRNRTSHTYNEAVAGQIAQAVLATYVPLFKEFEHAMSAHEPGPPGAGAP